MAETALETILGYANNALVLLRGLYTGFEDSDGTLDEAELELNRLIAVAELQIIAQDRFLAASRAVLDSPVLLETAWYEGVYSPQGLDTEAYVVDVTTSEEAREVVQALQERLDRTD